MKTYKLLITILLFGLCSCASPPPIEQGSADIGGDQHWTLDFFYFYMGKQTHTETLQFVSRRDCFDTLYQMQVDSKKKIFHSGAGICMKRFVEGQKRTHNDVLGYR